MKNKFAFILGIFFQLTSLSLIAQSPNLQWVNCLPNNYNFQYGSKSFTSDKYGNLYHIVRFSGKVDFDPGPGIAELTSVGTGNVSLSKYDSNGNFIWAKFIPSHDVVIKDVEVDEIGNIILTGNFCGTVDFDPSVNVANLTSNGCYSSSAGHIFLAKYNSDGNYLWAFTVGNYGSCCESANDAFIDKLGNIYIIGQVFGTNVDLDPGPDATNLNGGILVAKYNSDGYYVWAKTYGNNFDNYGNSIYVDDTGDIFISGSYTSSTDFDPSNNSSILTSIGDRSDAFFAKYDALGNYIWAKSISGSSTDQSSIIKTDIAGNVYVIGTFGADITGSTSDFDPGDGSAILTNLGQWDAFFAKYDSDGNYLWAKSIGSSDYDNISNFEINDNNLYLIGSTKKPIDFDPNGNSFILKTDGSSYIYIAKYDLDGNLIRVDSLGGGGGNCFNPCGKIDNSNLLLAGYFDGQGDVDFDLGESNNITHFVSGNLFLAKYKLNDVFSTLNYPKISLNTSLINSGQSISITGKDFKPTGTVNITIEGPDGNSQNANNITTNGQGFFNYNFVTTATMPLGVYSIKVTDNLSGLTTPIKQFTLKSSSNQANNLTITSPYQTLSVEVNENILIEWKDKMVLGKSYTVSGSKRYYKYSIEISQDNGSTWKTLKTFEGQQYVESWIMLNYSTSIAIPGSGYIFRIADFYNNNNLQITPAITVIQATQTKNIKADLNWDNSFPKPSCPVEGIAAEGTARIFLNLTKINSSSGPAISSVKVVLSDEFNGNNPDKLGKVKVATQTSSYSSEANGTVTITATDNTANKDNYIFWYVAPDDFAGGDPKDLKSSSRFVTATFTVYYANGTTEILPKPIRIVRPPLMLVHGLASDASTWDNFRHNDLGYEMKFIEDFRFNTCRAINMYPDAFYRRNAEEMTFGFNNPSINSFQGVICDLRNKGYAANRVDYVCHSMGGCVLRSIYDNYYPYFTRTGNASSRDFKNYENGYVNKVITIGTPNNGSPLADIVNRYAGDLPYSARFGLQMWYSYPNTNKPLPLMFLQPEDLTKLVPTYKASDAVKDLQINDSQGGVNFGVTNVRAHLISGDFFPGAQYNTNGLIPQEIIHIVKNSGDESLQKILNYFLKIALEKEPDPILNQALLQIMESKLEPIEKALVFFDKMAKVMDAFNVGTFIPESDMVVSIESQLAGYSKPAFNGNSNVSAYDNFVGHAFFRAETKNMDIGNRVNYLLNSDINSSLFDIIPATPVNMNKSGSIFNNLNDNIIISKVDKSKLQIITPQNSSIAYVDSIFHIQFSIKDTINLKSVELMFQNKSYNVDSLYLGNIDMNIQVNSNMLDNQMIMLEGYYMYPDSAVFVYDQINVNVLTNETLMDFEINPKILYLFKDQTKNPEYIGIYQTSLASGNFSSNISAIVNDTTVVKFDFISKGFKGISTGETFATISYKGFSDTLYFVVDETNIDSTTVGLNEPLVFPKSGNPNSVKIYPNPFKLSTNVVISETNSHSGNEWTIVILDLMGKEVKRQKSLSPKFIIYRDGLPTGLYFYNLKGKTGNISSGKIMITD